jgi:hypothetical protein
VLNRALFTDFRLQHNLPLNGRLSCLFRKMGLDLLL